MIDQQQLQAQEQEAKIRALRGQNLMQQISQAEQSQAIQEQEKGMATEQLDLTEEKRMISNLLRGRIEVERDGMLVWIDPPTNENKILTEAGIHFVLNSISWYLNKNTLLSNYDEDVINAKMEDYANSLNDILFMRSDIYFLVPTDKEVAELYEKRLNERVQKQMEILRIKGFEGDEKEIKNQLLKEVDLSVEFDKLKAQMKNDKLRGYEHLIRVIQDAVHSTYQRAYRGEERKSLRQHMHLTETKGQVLPQKKGGGFNPFNLLARR